MLSYKLQKVVNGRQPQSQTIEKIYVIGTNELNPPDLRVQYVSGREKALTLGTSIEEPSSTLDCMVPL